MGDGKMQYRFMGKTGLKVSEICLGAMTFGETETGFMFPGIKEEDVVYKILDRFAEKGGNFIDTADGYNSGNSEVLLGKWLEPKNRDDFVIATKFFFPTGKGPNDGYGSRKHILSAVEASLKRMKTSYIDLYQMHCYDNGTPLEETLTTLHDLVRCGKVRYIGASNYTGYQLQKAIETSRRLGLEIFTCLQPQYNLVCRTTEWELIPVCINEGLGVIPWSPLSHGMLSGKYSKDKQPDANTRLGWADTSSRLSRIGYSAQSNDYTWNVIDTLKSIATETNKSVAQIAIRWIMQKPGITAPIIGARSLEQLDSNLGSVGWSLTVDQMKKLDEISNIALPYPYHFPGLHDPSRY